MDTDNYITLGQGSYGTILMNKNNPEVVIKIHQLSSYEIEYANEMSARINMSDKQKYCAELFNNEFSMHFDLFSNKKHVSVIIPRPIEYEYITRNKAKYISSDYACTYKMQKLHYPTKLQNVILAARLKDFKKTNVSMHSPPYLFFSGISPDFQNGIVQLSDMDKVQTFHGLYYVINNNTITRLAESVIDCFFQLTYRNEVILQDVEFLLTDKGKDQVITAGMIDFNQVVNFTDRINAVKGRVGSEYSIEYDIANTYLFLSGIDTGFFMTDRNTNWKFMPTPHILPHVFFGTINKELHKIPDKYRDSYLKTISHICGHIYQMELHRIHDIRIVKRDVFDSLYNKIMIWHELLVYGMLIDADEPLDIVVRMDKLLHYAVADENALTIMANKYLYFTNANTVNIYMKPSDYTYFVITSKSDNNSYVERFQKSIKNGEMTGNLIYEKYPHVWFDIMYQRLFLIKYLATNINAMTSEQIDTFGDMLNANSSYKQILKYFHLVNPVRKHASVRAKNNRITRKAHNKSKSPPNTA